MILGFAHPGIVVPDLEKARAFYEKMFGFKVIANENWKNDAFYDQGTGLKNSAAKVYVLKGHNCFLELFEYTAPEQMGQPPVTLGANEMGIRHLAFYVDDIWREFYRLKSLGGIHMNEPVGNAEVGYVVYCRDPFGNIIELTTFGGPAKPLTILEGISGLDDFEG